MERTRNACPVTLSWHIWTDFTVVLDERGLWGDWVGGLKRHVEATSAKTSVYDHTAGTGLERVRIPPYGGSSRRSTISTEGSLSFPSS